MGYHDLLIILVMAEHVSVQVKNQRLNVLSEGIIPHSFKTVYLPIDHMIASVDVIPSPGN